MATFAELLALHAATTLARQRVLAQVVGERPCRLELREGVVAFGEDMRFPVQVLGTWEAGTGDWRWAWAETGDALPARLLSDGFALRNQGEANGLRALSARGGTMDRAGLDAFAAVCRGLTGAGAWQLVEGDAGTRATLVLLRGLPARVAARVPDGQIRGVLEAALARFDVVPRQAAMHFMSQQGFGIEETPDGFVARRGRDSRFVLAFDAAGRLARLEDPAQAARLRPWWRPW